MKVMLIDTPEDPLRLAFLHIFTKREALPNDDGSPGTPKFEATALIQPGGANQKRVEEAIVAVAKEKYGDEMVDELDRDGEKTGKKVPAWKAIYAEFTDDQKGLRKGNLKKDKGNQVYSGFEDMLYVCARNTNRPGVFDRDTSPLVAEDGRPYSGCYGNVEVDVWALKKQGVKKRIVIDLLGVQFTRDGDAFGSGSAPSQASSFASLSAADGDTANSLLD